MQAQGLAITFVWVRDPERRFRIRTVGFQPFIKVDSIKALRNFEMHFPLDPKSHRPLLSAPASKMLLDFAAIESMAGALDFVNSNGPLTRDGRSPSKGESVQFILDEAGRMHDLIQATADGDKDEIIDYLSDYGFGSLEVDLNPFENPPTLSLRVPDLLGALKFMLAEKLASGTTFRRCPYRDCGKLFDVGEGTGRTLKAVYCSREHQVLENSKKRSEGN